MRPLTAPAMSAGSGGAPFLPVLSGTPRSGSLSSSRRRTPKPWEDKAEQALVKSLQLKNDARYTRMNHCDQGHADGDVCGHATLAMKANRHMVGLEEDQAVATQASTFNDTPSWDTESLEAAGGRTPRKTVATVDNCLEWQECLDHEVRRLFLDFQLSDVPACRLNHLDRMHNWFVQHGGKQARKAREGPSYLTADRDGKMWEGSTRDLPKNGNTPSAATRQSTHAVRRLSSRGGSKS